MHIEILKSLYHKISPSGVWGFCYATLAFSPGKVDSLAFSLFNFTIVLFDRWHKEKRDSTTRGKEKEREPATELVRKLSIPVRTVVVCDLCLFMLFNICFIYHTYNNEKYK